MARDSQIVAGMRGPRDSAPERSATPTVRATAADASEVIYVARASKYRLQLIAADDIYNPLTGHREKGKSVFAQFKDHVFRTKDASLISMMEAKKDYGLGRDFWRQEDEQKAVLKGRADSLASQLQSVDVGLLDPETRARLAKALGAEVKPEFVPAT